MNWIDVNDKLPELGQKVIFKLHGYEMEGSFDGTGHCCGLFSDPLTSEYKLRPIFRSENVNTLEATHWRPLDEEPS